jgi:hypothetical protein
VPPPLVEEKGFMKKFTGIKNNKSLRRFCGLKIWRRE